MQGNVARNQRDPPRRDFLDPSMYFGHLPSLDCFWDMRVDTFDQSLRQSQLRLFREREGFFKNFFQ